jgi:hypothetical protein
MVKWRGLDKINVHKYITYNFSTTKGPYVYDSWSFIKNIFFEKIMQCPPIKSPPIWYGNGFF